MLIMLVGLPQCGKSKFAFQLQSGKVKNFKHLSVDNTVILSGSEIRRNILKQEQKPTAKIINDKLIEKLVENTSKGYNVIIDANNITYKIRKKFLEAIKNFDVFKIAYVMNVSLETYSSHFIGKDFIYEAVSNFQCPQLFEGFDKILFCYPSLTEQDVRNNYGLSYNYVDYMKSETYEHIYNNMRNIIKHGETADKFCEDFAKRLLNNGIQENQILLAARLCFAGLSWSIPIKNTKDKIINYPNYFNIGAYYICSHISELFISTSVEDILFILFLVNYQNFFLYNRKKINEQNKFRELVGDDWYNKLFLFYKIKQEHKAKEEI